GLPAVRSPTQQHICPGSWFTTPVSTQDNAVIPEISTLSYEQARDELVQVVARLETGGEPLEASLALWERGEALAARCQEWLDGARERLASARSAGSPDAAGTTTPAGSADEDPNA